MFKIKTIPILCCTLPLILSMNAYAGIMAPTAHSRANCGNNESITWHLGHSYWYRVISFHYPIKGKNINHVEDTGKAFTWRSAAVHWGESFPGGQYFVQGFHYYYPWGEERLDVMTSASDCNIYDGWWDY